MGLHPTNDNNAYQQLIFQCIQQRLITLDSKKNEYVPQLLKDLPIIQPDSLSYLCYLRDDIIWDDGSLIGLEDVLFTFKIIACPLINNPDQKSYFNNLQSIKTESEKDRSFIIRFREKYFDNAGKLAKVWLIQKKRWDPKGVLEKFNIEQFTDKSFNQENFPDLISFAAEYNHPENGRNPEKISGLGSYKVSEWKQGSHIILKKKNFNNLITSGRKIPGGPEKIIFRILGDMESVVLSLKKEEIDVSLDLSSAGLKKLQKKDYFNKAYNSCLLGSSIYTYLGMNLRPGIDRPSLFTDINTRHALACLIPVDEIIQISAKGTGKKMPGFVLPGNPDFNPDIPTVKYDPNMALQLLKKAGWIDRDGDGIREKIVKGKKLPFIFTLSYMASPVAKEIALLIRNSLLKAGIEANPEPMDFQAFYSNAARHQFDAMLGSWSSTHMPEDPRQLWHTESWMNNGSNFTGFGNDFTDSLIENINQEMDPSRRSSKMRHFQKIVSQDFPCVFLFNATKKTAVHKRFIKPNLFPESPYIELNKLILNRNNGLISPATF